MFENISGNNGNPKREERLQREAEDRNVNFSREQNSYAQNATADQVDISIQESKSDLIKWQQDLEQELFELVLQLRGATKGEDGLYFIPTNANPLCNNLFINDVVIPQCKPFIARYFINSNLDETRILGALMSTCNDICNLMADGYDIYDIEFIKYDDVMRIIKNVLIPSAFRALNGWTKKTDSTNFRRIESSYDAPSENRKHKAFGIGA